MIQNNSQNVLAAFDVLIEEIEDVLRSIDKAGASALEDHNYDRAQTAIEHARSVMLVREKVASLRGQWKDFEGAFSVEADSEQQTPHSTPVQRQTSMHSIPSKPRPVVHHELPHPVGR